MGVDRVHAEDWQLNVNMYICIYSYVYIFMFTHLHDLYAGVSVCGINHNNPTL